MTDSLNLKKVETIVLDIDDTLNSLTLTIMGDIFHCPVGRYDYHLFPSEMGYDIIGAVNKLLGLEGDEQWQVKEFWDAIPRELWATAPLSKEFDYLLERSTQLVGRDNVVLASTPTKCSDAHAGKHDWITRYLPSWIHRQYSITPRKWLLANPTVLLIDDHDENINKFRENRGNALGGQGLVVPRPWNSSCELNTMDYLVQHLGDLE